MGRSFSAYLHFPYCWSKCSYCAFNSVHYDKGQSLAFIQALKDELTLYSLQSGISRRPLTTVFMGGGTPTIFKAAQLLDVLDHIRTGFDLETHSEITVEANPGTVNLKKLRELSRGGVTRLSMGFQSFREKELEFLGRVHTVSVAREAFRNARTAGFQYINIDLIYGLPGQCWDDIEYSLLEAVRLGPEHIAAYSLTPEEGTPIGDLHSSGQIQLQDEPSSHGTDVKIRNFLKSFGYRQYEVSNFSRPGSECRHNLGYWEDRDYIGLGPGAHSFIHDRRFSNIPDIPTYIKKVQSGNFPVESCDAFKEDERFFDALAFGLRKIRGVDFEDLINRYRPRNVKLLFQRISDWTRAGFLIWEGSSMRLSQGGFRVWDRFGEEILACYSMQPSKRGTAEVLTRS